MFHPALVRHVYDNLHQNILLQIGKLHVKKQDQGLHKSG